MPNLATDPFVWHAWDGLETVRYESARRSVAPADTDPQERKNPYQTLTPFDPARVKNPNTIDTGFQAKRRSIHSAEKSPSGGAYMGYEVNWWVPLSQFAPGSFSPKAADVIVDADGNRWTVLRTLFNAPSQNWQLSCVNLVLALDLRDTINIERATITYDAAGSALKLFPANAPALQGGEVLYTNLPSRVQLLTQEILEERGIRGFKGTYAVTVGQEIAVTNEDRIAWRGRYLEIRGYHNATRLDELPVIDAELLP